LLIDFIGNISPHPPVCVRIFHAVRGKRQEMTKRLKLAATALVLMLALAFFSRFLNWMNLPSDLWFWSGTTCAVQLLVVGTSMIAGIWRTKRR